MAPKIEQGPTITVTVGEENKAAAQQIAAARGLSLSELFRQIIQDLREEQGSE
jgi:antitoxin component of RelBE/YafQ-DinJ toxin-antitoxin module